MRLSLLPLEMVEEGINKLISSLKNDLIIEQDFSPFVDYFIDTWTCCYKIKDWCVAERRYRTNNALEGYNSKVKHFIQVNPSVWIFLEGLLDLAFDADSEFVNAKQKPNLNHDIDRSRISPILDTVLPKLKNGEISIMDFLARLTEAIDITDYEIE